MHVKGDAGELNAHVSFTFGYPTMYVLVLCIEKHKRDEEEMHAPSNGWFLLSNEVIKPFTIS